MLSLQQIAWAFHIGPSTHLCAECDATSNQEHLAKRFKNIEIDTQEFERVSYAEALANPCSSNKLFHSIPGCTVKTRCCLEEGGDASLVQCELRNVGHAEGTGQWKCIRSSLGRWLCRNLRPSQRRGQFAMCSTSFKTWKPSTVHMWPLLPSCRMVLS